MNRGVLQSSPVQQMMAAGNPNWWNINTMRPPPPPTHLQQQQQPPPSPAAFFPQFTPSSSSSSSSSNSLHIPSWHERDNQELPHSWSQLLLGGLMGEEEALHHVKQENPASAGSYVYGHATASEGFQANKPAAWSHQIMAAAAAAAASSSPKSCATSFSSSTNMLEFSGNKADCNESTTGGAMKKARVQPSATQSSFKVRKEKLGDRITALHQLVSPFGKTDTASVLLEAIGYIRFLQSQIEALSLPYLGNGQGNTRQKQPVQGERNCIFPEDPGQLLNENSLKRKGGPDQQECREEPKDLRSRGLCLVPVSCTLHVGSDNGADYWAPAFGGEF
ncbi:BASIC HELIX LOOP HELIX 68, PERICYCLE FACTOR TYPE-A 3 [Hibiscus trionum]|uniref:BASIC HELIX LOOP HELIX 68, PERICYCLE FACTOR TYPE-A 3 n=1 Tax=Hibiscus trionum TaxID=183268 RepID=A0A9W7IKC9_HIBTR|nr:BASIC HELIX LOOP HELIX 68, PERICYCLE FACTOR TYPE-A 3 [Hibiscus trionum]